MQDRTALVTGAASGIGRAVAEFFAARGANVVVSDVDEAGSDETVERIRAEGGRAAMVPCDVSRSADVERLLDRTIETFGRLDHACNDAGVEGEQAPTAECTEDNWHRVIGVNLMGAWLCMKHEIARMLDTGGGSIVNVSSIAGLIGFPGLPAYVASKHGLVGLTRNAALEYADRNIRVNAVCPGAIHTPMIDRVIHEDRGFEKELLASHPLGRMGEPSEIAELVVWLCSDAASFVTGQAIAADGGYVAR